MPVTALPTPPSRSDPVNFAARADSFHGALPTFATELNTLQADVVTRQGAVATNTTAAAASATAAQAAQAAAEGAALAQKWVSGTNYTAGQQVYSPTNNLNYRCIVSVSPSTVDPISDSTHWGSSTTGMASLAGVETLTGKTMTGASNTFSNIPTSALTGTVAIANGGTAATTIEQARGNLFVPSTTGVGASGTWTINITGGSASASTAAACSGNSATATKAGSLGSGGTGGAGMLFTYSGTAGTPMWLWGSNTGDGSNSSVFNPANFSVSYAANAGNAGTVSSITSAQVGAATVNLGVYGVGSYVFAKNFTGSSVGPAGVVAGSSLTPSDSGDGTGGGGTMVGTWQLNGWCANVRSSLWLRIA